MSKTILICGYGTGISSAVARKFGAEGFSVALAARSKDKLAAAATELQGAGVKAAAFPTDLGDRKAVAKLVADAREKLGPITVIHWNAYAGGAADFTSADLAELGPVLDVSVTGMLAAVQAALPDLKTQKDAAVLVTGGGLCMYDPKVDAMAVQWNAMGLALGKAAQHKAVGLLAEKLRPLGIHVGEVMVLGSVKGTAFDSGNATLEPAAIAEKFWEQYTGRKQLTINAG